MSSSYFDTGDIAWSQDMGGKEGLSALGWSRVYRDDQSEVWRTGDKDVFGEIWLCNDPDATWDAQVRLEDNGVLRPGFATPKELMSMARRCIELAGGDAS